MVTRVGGSTATATPPTEAKETTVTVKKGETAADVASRSGVAESDLQKANPKVNIGKLSAGQELSLPAVQKGTDQSTGAPPATSEEAKADRKGEHQFAGEAKARSLNFTKTTEGTGPAAPPRTSTDTLKPGDKGSDVESLQKDLNGVRSDSGKPAIKEDGSFGQETGKAVSDFQKTAGMKADGKANAETRDRLGLENDINFKKLPENTKEQTRALMELDQKTRDEVKSIATDPTFAKLPKEVQDKHLEKLATNLNDPAVPKQIKDSMKDRASMEENKEFQKLPAETQGKLLKSMDSCADIPAGRANVMKLATDINFQKLSPAIQDKAIQTMDRNPADNRVMEPFQKMVGKESFQKLDDATKTRVLDLAKDNALSPRYMADMQKMVGEDRFVGMKKEDQAKTLNVFENTSPAGREALMQTMNKDIDGKPALLTKGYNNTGTLLDQLDRASTTPLDARVKDSAGNPASKKQFTEDLLKEVANPNQNINQHNRGTCTVTGMTSGLANKNPAEYARIATDLATTGQSKLANGDTITPPADGFAQDNSNRSTGERLMQSALMNYGKPGGGYQNWNAGTDGVRGTPDDGFADVTNPTARALDGFPPNSSGLVAKEEERVLSALHNKKMEIYEGSMNFRDDKKDILEKTEDQLKAGKGPVQTDVTWGTAGHAVEVTKVENGRVYYRNPWGGNIAGVSAGVGPTDPPGPTPARVPPRRIEDGANGIESMSQEDYLKIVRRTYIEK